MSFVPPPDDREPEITPPHAPWLEPPRNEIGSPVPERLLLARNDEVAIALVNLVAYSTGVTFDLALRAGRGHAFGPDLVFSLGGFWRHPDARVTEDEILRFGVEFADGRRVLDMGGEPVGDDGRPGIVLSPNGGGGGSATEHESGYWLYPLPPSGAVTFAVEWPAKGIPQTARVLDGSLLSEAGARALRQPSTSRSGRSRDRAAIRRHCGGR